MKIKLNAPMKGFEAGREIIIETDENSLPLDKFWRRRLKDSKTDNCLEVIKPSKKSREKK